MVDATTDPEETSNNGKKLNTFEVPPQTSAPDPEVHILEEHVTRVADKSTKPNTEKPVPSVQTVTPPVGVPETKQQKSVPAPIVPTVTPQAAPRPNTPTPAPPTQPPEKSSPIAPPSAAQENTLADDVGLVLKSNGVPGPKTPPVPSPSVAQDTPPSRPTPPDPTPSNPNEPALGNDIAKILAEVKLPERRGSTPQSEKSTGREEKKYDTGIVGSALNNESPPPPQENAVNPEPKTPPVVGTTQKKDQRPNSIAAVHTLKNDLQEVVRDQKMSVVKAASLEEDRKARKASVSEETLGSRQRSSRTFGVLFASLTLFGLGAGALFGVLFFMNKQSVAPQIDTGSSILFAEQSVLFSIDAQPTAELKRALGAGRTSSQGALGSITRIIPVTAVAGPDGTPQNRPATFGDFMVALGAHPPTGILRALGDDFFLGIHAVDKNAPLIVIPVTSHARAFEAMLNWEESLNSDLTPFFTSVAALRTDENGVPSQRTYEDFVMRNYDVRALRDDSGTIQLYYSFPTQNILIIAESPYSFPEILSRLQASRQL